MKAPLALLAGLLLLSGLSFAQEKPAATPEKPAVTPGAPTVAPEKPAARTCSLPQLASLDMLTTPDGKFEVPVTLNGRPVLMLVDTGSTHSSITFETAAQLGLKLQWTPFGGTFLNNVPIFEYASLDEFKIGPVRSSTKWQVLIIPNYIVTASTAGLLGPDVMSNMDVEFDFLHGKMNLFEHNQCDGHVVYWTHDPYAVLPIDIKKTTEHIDVKAWLDGKLVTVTFDTGSPLSIMSLDAARDLFGWDEKDPRLKSLTAERINGGESTPRYTFPFATLNFDGVAVNNPQITLIPNDHFMRSRNHDAIIVLGMTVLRQLRMYVDYQDQKIYLTAAEAH